MKSNYTDHQFYNGLLAFLNALSTVNFWICTPDYQTQVFLSDGYEKIWQRPKLEIQNDLSLWSGTLLAEDWAQLSAQFAQRGEQSTPNELLFRIHRPDYDLRFIKNTSITLFDSDGQAQLIAGVDESVPFAQWEHLKNVPHADNESFSGFIGDFARILCKETRLLTTQVCSLENTRPQITIRNQPIALSKREGECLMLLSRGLSSKQVASQLGISTRTVEHYFAALRKKADVRSKLELLSLCEPQLELQFRL